MTKIKTKPAKVVINGESMDPVKKIKFWEQEGMSRRKARELIEAKRKAAEKTAAK